MRGLLAPYRQLSVRERYRYEDASGSRAYSARSPIEANRVAHPRGLEQVVMTCLEKNPDKRPQNAMELAKMLSDCSVDEPWTPQRAEGWWRTHHPENLDPRSQV